MLVKQFLKEIQQQNTKQHSQTRVLIWVWVLFCWFFFSEKELSVLRKENRKNAALAVAMVLLIALIYTCWTM